MVIPNKAGCERQAHTFAASADSADASVHMKVSAKNAPFSLWGGCSYCNQQDKNDPGMRVSEAVTRDASQVSKLGDIRGADEQLSRLSRPSEENT